MADPALLLVMFAAGTIAVAIATATVFRAWWDWLDLKRLEIGRNRTGGTPSEITDLRQRIRRLESIADGER
jgi:hypothetical protein